MEDIVAKVEAMHLSFWLVHDCHGYQPKGEMNIRQTIETYLEEEENPCAKGLLSVLNYEYGARCKHATVARSLDSLIRETHRILHCLSTLETALDIAGDYGYEWPCINSYLDDTPTRGDDVWYTYLRPYVKDLEREYRCGAVFMTRSGQRSQRVSHTELDTWTGLTEGQKRKRDHEHWVKRQRRNEEIERVRVQKNTDEQRIRQLEVELDQLRKKQGVS